MNNVDCDFITELSFDYFSLSLSLSLNLRLSLNLSVHQSPSLNLFLFVCHFVFFDLFLFHFVCLYFKNLLISVGFPIQNSIPNKIKPPFSYLSFPINGKSNKIPLTECHRIFHSVVTQRILQFCVTSMSELKKCH